MQPNIICSYGIFCWNILPRNQILNGIREQLAASMATQLLLLLAQISSNEIPDWLIHFIFQNEIITLITFASLLLSVHSAGSGNKLSNLI